MIEQVITVGVTAISALLFICWCGQVRGLILDGRTKKAPTRSESSVREAA